MQVRIWAETLLADRVLERKLIYTIEREAVTADPEEIGLGLEEGKALISQIQTHLVQAQAEALEAAHRRCVQCGRLQRIKDRRSRTVRTVFGRVRVSGRRFERCACRGGKRATIWILDQTVLPGTTPEIEFLYSTWGSKMPYRRAAKSLAEVLPIRDSEISHTTLRRHTLMVGSKLDQRVSEPDEYDWPEARRQAVTPAGSLSVAIDGTYIRANRIMGFNQYHVVAGRIERDGTLGGCFAWVAQHHSCDQEAFMKAALHDNGWTPNSNLRVLADGADGLTNLVKTAANKKTCEAVLDWFHISMRLRPIEVGCPVSMERKTGLRA